jgi:hypothetical protein
MLIINLINSSLVLLAVFFFTYIYGKFLIYFCNYKKKDIVSYNILLLPVSGFAFIATIVNFFYFFLNLNIDLILFILIFLQFLFLFLIDKQRILKDFFTICLKVFPIILIFLSFILIQGEQFYIFRGNYWDNANYISQALVIKEYNFREILDIKLYSQNVDFTSSYLHLGRNVITARPLVGLLLAFFLKLNFIDFFFLNNLFKIYLICLIFLSFYNLFSKILSKYTYFISFCFIFSFWSLYVYDQEALSHLAVLPLFISIIFLLLSSDNNFLFNHKYNLILFLIFNISFFLIYPEFFALYLFFLLFFILFKYKILPFVLNFYKNILILIFFFLIFTLPTFSLNYLFLFNQLSVAFVKPDYWGYFGAFLSGSDNSYLTLDNILFIKSIANRDYNFLELLKAICSIFYKIDFYILPLNIIPSLFGLYYLTLSTILLKLDFIKLFFLFLLNLYLIKIFLENFRSVLKHKSDLIILFKSYFTTSFIFILLLSFNKNFWGMIKLYLYFSPVLFLFMIVSLKKNFKKELKINLLFCILIVVFPLYKFSVFNSGIGRYDTFPSIINPYYKKDIDWYINTNKLANCMNTKIASSDVIVIRYLSIKLNYLGYRFNNGFYTRNHKNPGAPKEYCTIKLVNSNFIVNE